MKNNNIPELTIKALLLGVFLALLMCAANTYLGLYAGMTVSASIPAAVISMGILRGILRRGTILENNIAQTSASAGESLAAGIIFTVPALVIIGAWTEFNFWATTLIAILGGCLGVLFMIPLRHTLIVEEKQLTYPEGVACAEVLKTGEKRGTGLILLFRALGLGAIFKLLVKGLVVVKGTVEGGFRLGRNVLYAGCDMSPALIGVGYIVGCNVSILVFIGGSIAWLFGIPIYSALHHIEGGALDAAWEIWSTKIRYMGVGAMVIGGLWSIIKVRRGIVKGLRLGFSRSEATNNDLPMKKVFGGIILVAIPVFVLYWWFTGSVSFALVSGTVMIVTAFFFVAVSSYIVGLVGSSNNPVSGMTICTLLFASIMLLLFRMTGIPGMIAALGVAGVVCCAACTAGDISQDLKTGWLVGAMPRRQQIAQIIGVVASAFIIAPILKVLHAAYGIGTGEPGSLQAPQASLFASLTKGLFTDIRSLPWEMVSVGAIIGIVLIVIDEVLRIKKAGFRMHVMPVAVGIYLPVSLSVPILIGGLLRLIISRLRKDVSNTGILFSSGLIAGEAIVGIILAGLIYAKFRMIEIIESNLISLAAFMAIIVLFVLVMLLRGGQKRIRGGSTSGRPI
jgi:putative OPT family oligopeptide transporter